MESIDRKNMGKIRNLCCKQFMGFMIKISSILYGNPKSRTGSCTNLHTYEMPYYCKCQAITDTLVYTKHFLPLFIKMSKVLTSSAFAVDIGIIAYFVHVTSPQLAIQISVQN